MARQAISAFIPSADPVIVEAVSATSNGVVHTVGKNRVFAINATQDLTIAFGLSTGAAASPGASNFRIPAGVTIQFDLGSTYDQFQVYNLGASSASVYAILLSFQ